jgi:phage FluMu protein Com
MEEVRCGNCNRKLALANYLKIEIKCPRCGTLNFLRATSPKQERHGASSSGDARGQQTTPHHPPIPGEYEPPVFNNPGYFFGSLGLAGFGYRDFYVAAIPRRLAVEIIIANHYSRRVVNNSYVHLGVFLDGDLVGVLQFGYALVPKGAGKVVADTGVTQYLELNRMWMDDRAPRNSESRTISYAIKYIRKACPGVAWVQSFADERCGRWGVVYQAANFLYVGHHWTSFYELDGETYHEMLLTAHKKGGRRGVFLRENLHRAVRHRLRQFRYVYFIRQSWRPRLKLSPLPYPKPGCPLPDRQKL